MTVHCEIPVDSQLAFVVMSERHAAEGPHDRRRIAVDALCPEDPLYEDPDAVVLTQAGLDVSAVSVADDPEPAVTEQHAVRAADHRLAEQLLGAAGGGEQVKRRVDCRHGACRAVAGERIGGATGGDRYAGVDQRRAVKARREHDPAGGVEDKRAVLEVADKPTVPVAVRLDPGDIWDVAEERDVGMGGIAAGRR